MTVLELVREIKFVLTVLTVSAIAMIGFMILYPEHIWETNGIYMGNYEPPHE